MKQRERVRAQQQHRRSRGGVVAEVVTRELEEQHQRGEKRYVRDEHPGVKERDAAPAEQVAEHAHAHRQRREEDDVLLAAPLAITWGPQVADARDAQVPPGVESQRQVHELAVGDAQPLRFGRHAERVDGEEPDREHGDPGRDKRPPRGLEPVARDESPERRQHPCQDMWSRTTDVTQRRERDSDEEWRPRRLDGELQDVAAELEAASDRRCKGSQRDRRRSRTSTAVTHRGSAVGRSSSSGVGIDTQLYKLPRGGWGRSI